MANNFPGPWEIRLNYVATYGSLTANHLARYNVDVSGTPSIGDPAGDFDLKRRSLSTIAFTTFIDEWIALLVPVYTIHAGFVSAELWKYDPGTYDATFYTSYAIGEDGTQNANQKAATEVILTFRSTNGGIGRLHFMEAHLDPGDALGAGFYPSPWDDIAAYVENANNVFLARDNGYLLTSLKMLPGQSEALFKRRFRA
jgi:hypothetical protein